PTNTRFDLGIGRDDVRPVSDGIDVTVHSLGAVASPASNLVLEDAGGRELARGIIPALAAPVDLLPKTAVVRLRTKAKWQSGMRVRIVSDPGRPEVTEMNNLVAAR
ncbi:MAG: hypothetical protein ACXWKW_06740, partial [Asticcacaulis sp.]